VAHYGIALPGRKRKIFADGRSVVDFRIRPTTILQNSQSITIREERMKYLFLAYADEQRLDAMSESERGALENACLANDEALRKSGHLLAVEALQNSHTATIVRVHNGRVSLADGPFAETKEQLIGIFTVSARDLNEAIQVASQMPQARGGPIEVRPILDLGQQEPR
jgi:hypothetical protein